MSSDRLAGTSHPSTEGRAPFGGEAISHELEEVA
jgi:hypothetical protein